MNDPGKSDRPTVPTKQPNKAGKPGAEVVEGRGLAKGNTDEQNASRTQSRSHGMPSELDRVREASASTSEPEAGAQCVSSARWDLRGGRPVRAVPTAIVCEQRRKTPESCRLVPPGLIGHPRDLDFTGLGRNVGD
jgi:hypothetical protein